MEYEVKAERMAKVFYIPLIQLKISTHRTKETFEMESILVKEHFLIVMICNYFCY